MLKTLDKLQSQSEALWSPSKETIEHSLLREYCKKMARPECHDFLSLHRWALENPAIFWKELWDFFHIIGDPGSTVLSPGSDLLSTRFFPEARLNFAENLLSRYPDDQEAIVFRCEDLSIRRRLMGADIKAQTYQVARFLTSLGLGSNDRVAAIMPNIPETVISMLGAVSLGATWSSCSPDFGVESLVDRLESVCPRVLVVCDRTLYNGKWFNLKEKNEAVLARLPSVQHVIMCSFTDDSQDAPPTLDGRPCTSLSQIQRTTTDDAWTFERFPFDHPLFVMFSSGTTGKPKGIVHRAGGVLLEQMKEHQLHLNIQPKDRTFYYTTCGWMMWNWHVSMLASGATLLLYEGSPMMPDQNVLWSYALEENMTFFGTSAKYLETLSKNHFKPAFVKTLRTMTSTGSPLSPETFRYVYHNLHSDIHLASISGGTDILGCFVLGDVCSPVHEGEIQVPSLGLDVAVYNHQGQMCGANMPGELVCRNAFPSMPVSFLNDSHHKKYRASYFDRFPDVWCHGDYIQSTDHEGYVILGRSDATLNPGGVRIGTAEIYRQVENIPGVEDSLVIGQTWDNDVRVVLFLKMKEGIVLDDEFRQSIKKKIREHTSPRHVPSHIVAAPHIPRTKNGKLMEVAVRQIIHGETPASLNAAADLKAFEFYRFIPDIHQ